MIVPPPPAAAAIAAVAVPLAVNRNKHTRINVHLARAAHLICRMSKRQMVYRHQSICIALNDNDNIDRAVQFREVTRQEKKGNIDSNNQIEIDYLHPAVFSYTDGGRSHSIAMCRCG